MKKFKLLKKLTCGIFVIAMLVMNFMPTVVSAAYIDRGLEEERLKVVEYNKYTIFYSDDYFSHPSTEYDEHLATASVIMTDSSVPRENPKSADDTEWYQNQPELLRGYFESIGFYSFETNEDYRKRTDFDTMGVAAAQRTVGNYTVIALTVRSAGYFHEWANNVWIGDGTKSDYMHEGWFNAANKAISFLDSYVKSKNITGKVKVWITGFSRGGAVANLTAGLLDNMIDKNEKIFSNGATLKHGDLYAYTFATPQGANYNSKTVKKPGDKIYNNIWNIVNPNDLVTKVAPSKYGFTRFGIDKYITTKFYDPDNYENNRDVFSKLLNENKNYTDYAGDTLDIYEIPGTKQFNAIVNLASILAGNYGAIGGMTVEYANDAIHEALDDSNWVVKDAEKVNYDSNIVSTIIIEELTNSIGSRKEYVKDYQDHLKKLLYAFMNDVKSETEATEDEIFDCLITSLIVGAVSDTYSLGQFGVSDIATLWAELSSNPDLKNLKDSIGPLLDLITDVYGERPNELLSLGKYAKNIFDNHQFEVNVAHLEAQDNYYIDWYNANHPFKAKIKLVHLRENADFGRISFKDFNDVRLFENDGKGTVKVIQIDGTSFGNSTMKQVNKGYAAGYYSYLTEEKVELFAPVNHNYIVNMQSFSKKPWHSVTFAANYYFMGPDIEGRQILPLNSFDDTVAFDSDFVQKGANFGNVNSQQVGTAFGKGNIIIISVAGVVIVGLTCFSIVYINRKKKNIKKNSKKNSKK